MYSLVFFYNVLYELIEQYIEFVPSRPKKGVRNTVLTVKISRLMSVRLNTCHTPFSLVNTRTVRGCKRALESPNNRFTISESQSKT